MRNKLPGAVAVLTISLTGCMLFACKGEVGEEIDQAWASQREMRGDTLVVRTTRGSIWRDTMALVPELSIGLLEGEDAYLLGSVRGFDVDDDGRIYVVDGQAQDVRVFSPDGEHIVTIGRGGEGPGEFGRPDYVRVTADHRIVVRDPPWRFSVFSREGEYQGGWLLLSGFSTSTPFFLDSQQRVLNPTRPGVLVRYTLAGSVVDTVPEPSRGYLPPRLEVTTENARASYSIPFMPSERWTMTRNGGFLFGLTSEYRIERWEANGAIFEVERTVDPVRVLPGEASQARERITQTIRRANSPSWHWQGPDVPSNKPPWTSLFAGLDGSIWVLRSSVAVEEPNPDWDPQFPEEGFPTRWMAPRVTDVFDAEGRYLGPVKIPEAMSIYPSPVFTEDRVWAVSTHQLGFLQIVRFRLEPEADTIAG